MDALTICGALTALALVAVALRRLRESRSEQCREWLGSYEEDWSDDELDALRSVDVASDVAA